MFHSFHSGRDVVWHTGESLFQSRGATEPLGFACCVSPLASPVTEGVQFRDFDLWEECAHTPLTFLSHFTLPAGEVYFAYAPGLFLREVENILLL